MKRPILFLIIALITISASTFARAQNQQWGGFENIGQGLQNQAGSQKKYDRTSDSTSQQSYKIGVGDLLQIEVYDEEDLTKEVRVLTDGRISFPLLGSLPAARLTVFDLEKEITRRLAEKYLVSPQVTVFVKEFSNIFVFGEVREPGSFPIYGNMTAFEAIALAGGFSELANKTKVKVIRNSGGQRMVLTANLDKLEKKGDASEDVELEANDRVVVSRGFF